MTDNDRTTEGRALAQALERIEEDARAMEGAGYLAALVAEDAGVLEHGLVGGGLGHDVLAGGQHAVAAGGAAGGDVGVGDVEHLVAEEGADPAHGPAVALVG